jgi:hypothetical protein
MKKKDKLKEFAEACAGLAIVIYLVFIMILLKALFPVFFS